MKYVFICFIILLSSCSVAEHRRVQNPKNTFEEREKKEKEITEKYIGMSEGAAMLLAEIEGYYIRVLIRDGKWASDLGESCVGNRINFNIKEGIIIGATMD